MRIFAISDLHTDVPANLTWIKSLEREADSVLLVAGDHATDLAQ